MKKPSLADWNSYKKNRKIAISRQNSFTQDIIYKIISHNKTKKIVYPQYKEAFEYVDKLFPDVEVKKVSIYECDREFLNEVGMGHSAGFYHIQTGIIVVCPDSDYSKNKDTIWTTVVASVKTDEVIVHELLHYVSLYNGVGSCKALEEEFAYGNSVQYLRNKGRSDDEIINQVFLPYFITTIDTIKIAVEVLIENGYDIDEVKSKTEEEQNSIMESLDKFLFEKTKKEATNLARQFINIHTEELKEKEIRIEVRDAFSNMDFNS